jgi:unsaturated rhamnogalacturonyl hydrolase
MRSRALIGLPLVLSALGCAPARAQAPTAIPATLKWSERMALSEIKRNPDPRLLDFQPQPKWEYTHGLLLLAIDGVRKKTGDARYLDYILSYYDRMIEDDGTIRLYDITGFNIDRVNPGRILFTLARETGKPKYTTALHTLRGQLEWQPRTREGGFWHKLVYPHQMWLDGAYMGSPFYAQYGKDFGDTAAFTDVARQLILMNTHMRDAKTGLLYHGWDESRLQAWANP